MEIFGLKSLNALDSLVDVVVRSLEESLLFFVEFHLDDLLNTACTDHDRNIESYVVHTILAVKLCGYCTDCVLVHEERLEKSCNGNSNTVECSALELDDLCAGRLCLLNEIDLILLGEGLADDSCILFNRYTCNVCAAPCSELCLTVLTEDVTTSQGLDTTRITPLL